MQTLLSDPVAASDPTVPAPAARPAPPAGQPPAPLRIAAQSRHVETLVALRECFEQQGDAMQLQIWPGDMSHLAARVAQAPPDILFIEIAGDSAAELDGLEHLLAEHPAIATILLCARPAPDVLLRALRCGVREVLPPPFGRDALLAVIQAVQLRRAAAPAPRPGGRILAVLPCKGGAGATFLAGNLAASLATAGRRVCLIDLNFYFGEAALYVSDSAPPSSVADVLQQIQRLDGPLLESSMLRVAPNFWLLAAPESIEQSLDIRPDSIERLLGVARQHYDFVLLDLSRNLDANAIKALDLADGIYLVLQATLPFLRDAARLLKVLRSLAYPADRIRLVLNRHEKHGGISLKNVVASLGHPISWQVPNSFAAVARAINQGRSLVELAPADPVAHSLQTMARQLAGLPPQRAGWLERLWHRKPPATPPADQATDLRSEEKWI